MTSCTVGTQPVLFGLWVGRQPLLLKQEVTVKPSQSSLQPPGIVVSKRRHEHFQKHVSRVCEDRDLRVPLTVAAGAAGVVSLQHRDLSGHFCDV